MVIAVCKGGFFAKILVGVGASLLAIGLLFYCCLNHALLMSAVIKSGALMNGTPMFDYWLHSPQLLRVYFFNVTNPVEVTNGAAPILKEVGPYVYNHMVHRIDISVKESDTVEFRERFSSHFNASLSGALRQTDVVTIMDFALMGTILAAEGMAKDQMDRVKGVIDRLFPNRATPFVTASVGEILFDGLPLNCSAITSMAHLICRQLTIVAPTQFWMDKDRVHRFAFLRHKNETNQDIFRSNRGVEDPYQRGQLYSYRNETRLKVWHSPYCNMLNGSSGGTVFPLWTNPQSPIYLFETTACRSLTGEYITTLDYHGITVNRFEPTEKLFGSAEVYPENECFCPRGLSEGENDTAPLFCPPAGILNLAMCTQVPVLISFPWFLYGDKKLSAEIFPDNSVYQQADLVTYVLIEPVTSTAVEGKKRLQFNLELRKIDAFPYLRKVTPRIMPGLWIEQSIAADSAVLDLLKSRVAFFRALHILSLFFIGLGVSLLLAGCFVFAAIHNGDRCGSSKVESKQAKVIDIAAVRKNVEEVQMYPSGPPAAGYVPSRYATSYQQHFM